MFRLSCIVCYTNGERVVHAICRELVLARTLKAEELPIECFVMRITEDRADT